MWQCFLFSFQCKADAQNKFSQEEKCIHFQFLNFYVICFWTYLITGNMCRNLHLFPIVLNFAIFKNHAQNEHNAQSFVFYPPHTDFLKNCAPMYGAQSGIYQCCRSWLWVNWNCVNIKRQSQSLVDCCRRMNEFSNVFAMMKYKPKGQTGSSGGQNVGDNEKIKQPALSHVQALGVGPSHKSCLSQHIATLFTQVSDKLAEKLLPSKHTNSN